MQYIAIGVVTKDLTKNGHRIGGTVTYASVTAKKLGKTAAVVTTAAPTFKISPTPDYDGISWEAKPSAGTATFRNEYGPVGRVQFLVEKPDRQLYMEDVPEDWLSDIEVLHWAPLVNDIPWGEVQSKSYTVLVTPQGWLRSWDSNGLVSLGQLPKTAERVLEHADVIVMSDEDLNFNRQLGEYYANHVNTFGGGVFVVTRGANGATVYTDYVSRHFPTRQANDVVDPTGAGDVFAAAYAIHYNDTHDPWESARFANAAASMSIEAEGISGIPNREKVELYLEGVLL